MTAGSGPTRQPTVTAAHGTTEPPAEYAAPPSDTLRAVMAVSPLAILTLDLRWNVTAWSSGAERVFGWSAAEVLGRPAPLAVPGHGEALGRRRARLLAGETIVDEEGLRRRKDGTTVPVRASIGPIRDPRGRIVGVVATFADRSDQQRAEETAGRLATLVDFSEDAIIGTTLDGTIVAWNSGAERLYGYAADDVIGRSVALLAPTERSSEIPKVLERLRRGERVVDHETSRVRKDGTIVPVSLRVAPITDTAGAVIGVSTTARDVTARHAAEDEIRRRAAHFEVLNEIITAAASAADLRTFLGTLLDRLLATLGGACGGAWLGQHWDSGVHVTRHISPEASAEIASAVRAAGLDLTRVLAVQDWDTLAGPVADVVRPVLRRAGVDGASITGPFLAHGQPIGGFAIATSRPRRWLPEEIKLADALSREMGAVAERLRLMDEGRARVAQLQALREIDIAITTSLDLLVPLGVVLDKIMALLETDAADVLVLNADSGQFHCRCGRGFRAAAPGRPPVPLGEGHVARAARERRPVSVPNLSADPGHLRAIHGFAHEGFVAYRAVPLIARGQVVGALETFHRRSCSPDPGWSYFLQALADQAAIAVDNAALFQGLQQANSDLVLAYDRTIEGWSRALDLRDEGTEGHTQRVTELTLRLARAMGVRDGDLVHVRRGALLHDIGKMAIPDQILLKQGPLTDAEWNVMKHHPVYARDLISAIEYLRPAVDIPYCHHERWDGAGYPRGLAGHSIPLAPRIFAVADVWDALTSDRPYRPAWVPTRAREYIHEQTRSQFDPEVVQTCLQALSEGVS